MEQQKLILNYGFFSAIGAGIMTFLFALFMFYELFYGSAKMLDYVVSILISFFFVIMVVALKYTLSKANKFVLSLAVASSIIYCILASIVYYVQISVVRLANLSVEQLTIVAQSPPGTAFFAIDLLAYFFLCVATFFIAIAMDKKEKVLRALLFIHSAMAIPTFILPLMPFIYEKTNEVTSIDGGLIALIGWSALFLPICILMARYFSRKRKKLSL